MPNGEFGSLFYRGGSILAGMSRSAAGTKSATDCPELVVAWESFNFFFEKPLPTSGFHDLVNKGKITPFKPMRGLYMLNESLRRLGLKEVRELPKPPPTPTLENIVRLAFTLIDRSIFPEPSWLLSAESIDAKDADHALRLADRCRDAIQAFPHVELKLAYFQGVLDWVQMSEESRAS